MGGFENFDSLKFASLSVSSILVNTNVSLSNLHVITSNMRLVG